MDKKRFSVVVALSGLAAAAMGLSVNSMGVFYVPVSESLNVTTGQFGSHTMLMMFAMAITGLALPKLMKKFSLFSIVLFGIILGAGSTFLMGMSSSIYSFYILGIIKGIGVTFYSMIIIMQVVNNWFTKNKGIYTSIIVSFSGLIGALASYIFGSIIQSYGWQIGYYSAALSILIFCAPTLLLKVQFKPESSESLNSNTSSEIIPFKKLDKSYLSFVGFAFIINFICGFVQYLPSYAASIGVAAHIGVLMLSFAQIGNVVSKLVIGFFVDWIGAFRSTLILICLGLISLIFLYFGISEFFFLSASLLFGVIYALASVSIPLLTELYFDKAHFAVAYATISMVMNVGSALSQSVYGFLYDILGSYMGVLLMVGVLYIIAFILVAYVNKQKKLV